MSKGGKAWGAWVMTGAMVAIALGACGKDPSLKAAKSECDAACAHIGELSGDRETTACSVACIQREWTVGDVGCIRDARTYDAAKDCAVLAKLLLSSDREAKQQALLAEARQKEEEQRKLEAQLKEQNAKIERLLEGLMNAKDEAERAALQKQLEDAQEAQNKLKGRPSGPRPSKACNCAPGDPLCSCL